MVKVLITGINGFVGKHLAREFIKRDYGVIGVGHETPPHVEVRSLAEQYFACDLTDAALVERLPLKEVDAVISLAGLAALGPSFDKPDEYMHVNTAVLSVICDEIIKQGLQPNIRMLAVSSGAVYASGQPMPLTEESSTDPGSSPYTAS
ncbi:MAG TPA: NAD-dependent epimerase/dehydratase family protein, partial [Patescibacteria group bacterium]|nr:NAD-dependent epimerase/dehydratase family protein [Patescibacteria group bacterium]